VIMTTLFNTNSFCNINISATQSPQTEMNNALQ